MPLSDDRIVGETSSFVSASAFVWRNASANGPHPPPRWVGAKASGLIMVPAPWSVALYSGFCAGSVPACRGANRNGLRRRRLGASNRAADKIFDAVTDGMKLGGCGTKKALHQVLIKKG